MVSCRKLRSARASLVDVYSDPIWPPSLSCSGPPVMTHQLGAAHVHVMRIFGACFPVHNADAEIAQEDSSSNFALISKSCPYLCGPQQHRWNQKHMTNMTDTLTPFQKELTTQLYTLRTWSNITTFVALHFPPASRKRVMTMLHSCPMDFDFRDWRGVVDLGIRKFL